jgi:hypothetical protein
MPDFYLGLLVHILMVNTKIRGSRAYLSSNPPPKREQAMH